MGSKGLRVRLIQKYFGLRNDGIFGVNTHKAVAEFQLRNGLVPDGIVGTKTWSKMGINSLDDSVRATKFTLTKHSIKEASIEDIPQLTRAIIPLFTDTPRVREIISKGLTVLYPYRDELKLNTPEQLAHFFGQIRQEVGRSWIDQENLNYSVKGLINTFGYYKSRPSMARKHGRGGFSGKANQKAIANHAYANRMGNGDIDSGDGWLYRGGGSKMVTGLFNHKELNRFMSSHMARVFTTVDFVRQPHLKWNPNFSLLTGAIFWGQHNLGKIVNEGGMDRQTSNRVTKVINRYTNSYKARWNHTKKAAKLLGVSHE